MTLRWDTSELDALALDMSRAPARLQVRAPKVFNVGANKNKKVMQRDAAGHGHLPHLQNHVSYDRRGLLRYGIGFDKEGQGHLANIAAFGSVNNSAVLDLNAPLRREIPHIMRELGDEGEQAVFGGPR